MYLFIFCKFHYIVIADTCCEKYYLCGCSSCAYSEGDARKSTPKTTPTAALRINFHLDQYLRRKFRELDLTGHYKDEEGTRKLIRMYEYAILACTPQEETDQGRLHVTVENYVYKNTIN
jgi:hypothetical protein